MLTFFSQQIKITSLFLTLSIGAFAQNNFWKSTTELDVFTMSIGKKQLLKPSAFKLFTLDTASLKSTLRQAPKLFSVTAKQKPLIVELPSPDGTFSRFAVTETQIMEPKLAAKYPEIKTYNGQGIDDPTANIKLSWTYNGFYATISSPVKGSVIVMPSTAGNKMAYMVYNLNDMPSATFIESKLEDVKAKDIVWTQQTKTSGSIAQGTGSTTQGTVTQSATGGSCLGTQLYTYRILMSCPGEYAQALGQILGYGTTITKAQVISDMVNKLNAININYERDLSISFILVANEDKAIFLDANTDPFSNAFDNGSLCNDNQTLADTYIGNANYDIGIVLSSDGSGVAQLNSVCVSGSKAKGTSGYPPNDLTNPHYAESISHEIGHEFSASHTFLCGNAGINAVEPAYGVTILSYAGASSTGCPALSNFDIPYFHTLSRGQIFNFITNSTTGGSCATITSTGNHPPVVNVSGAAYSIPKSTPFTMTGSATDPDGDALTYMWEEFDAGTTQSDWNQPTGTAPLFKDFLPTTSPSRTFPQISDIVTGFNTPGEFLANYARDINLRLTVRDNWSGGGGVCSADAVVTVTNSDPFIITSQTSSDSWVANGTNTATITWNVASTNIAPINCANVDILLSIDGGFTYPYTLASNTPNDGSQNIVIPNYTTFSARVMVRSVGNVFFNINSSNFSIQTTGCGAEGSILSPDTAVSALPGDAKLNLNIAPQYRSGTLFSTVSGNFSLSDAPTPSILQDVNGERICYTSTYHSQYWYIVPSVTGSYTFSRTGNNILNLFSTPFDINNTCPSFIKSSFVVGGSFQSSITATLTMNTPYVLVSMWVDNNYPNDFSNTLTAQPAGSSLYLSKSPYIDPGSAYSYKYVIVNSATNNIVNIATTADLSNATTYSVGNYVVYGLSYSNAITTATLNAYVGGSLSALTNQITANPSAFCANMSKNSISVQVGTVVVVTPPPTPFGFNYSATPLGLYGPMYAGATTIGSGGSVKVGTGGNWGFAGNITSADKGGNNAPNSIGRTEIVTLDSNGTYGGVRTIAGASSFVIDGYAASTAAWTGTKLPIGTASAVYPLMVPSGKAVTAAYFAGSGITQAVPVSGSAATEYSPYIDFPYGIPAGNYTISYPAGLGTTNNTLLSSANTSSSGTNSSTTYSLLKTVPNFLSTAGSTTATLPATAITQLYFASSSIILPVTWVSFTGLAVGCTAKLAWQTASENNNSYYAVEVSIDGTIFSQVAKLGSKNSSSGANYNYNYALGDGAYYFRLKAVDNDGNFSYSNVVMVNGTGACSSNQQIVVSPNPTKNVINITGLSTNSHLVLYDMGGKKMTEIFATSNKQSINMGMYASGIYILHILATDGKTSYVKVVKE